MIKVMIVEDEPPIARALGKLIEKSDTEYQISGIAENGKEAIEKYDQWKPDMIFTDIRMPVMDGFQFLEYLKSKKENPVTYILSGYQDFNYARQALNYNVRGYLLKPVVREELRKILEETKNELEKKAHENKETLIKTTLHQTQKMLEPGKCIVGLFCFGTWPMGTDDGMLPGVENVSQIPLDKIVAACCQNSNWVINADISVERIAIIEGSDGISTLKNVFEKVKCVSKIPVTLLTHEQAVSISSIGTMYKILKRRMPRKIILGQSAFIAEDVQNEKKAEKSFHMDLSKIHDKIINSDISSSQEVIKNVLEICEKEKVSQWKLAKYLNIVMGYYYEKYPSMQMEELETEDIISNVWNYDKLYRDICSFLDTLYSRQPSEQVINPLAKKIKEYLDENYAKVITSGSLSEEFGFVSAYLSRVFKNQYGITPGVYLVKVRIDHAKRLLKDSQYMRIKDVAEAVGYNDQYYFSKVFHKHTSMWPLDYKNRS